MLDDIASATLQVAISGLSQRQQVTSNNIANSETPDFRASQVEFESSLADAVRAGDPAQATVSQTATADQPGVNGNNVSLDREFVSATTTTLQEQLLTQALTSKFSQLDTVLKG